MNEEINILKSIIGYMPTNEELESITFLNSLKKYLDVLDKKAVNFMFMASNNGYEMLSNGYLNETNLNYTKFYYDQYLEVCNKMQELQKIINQLEINNREKILKKAKH